MAPIQRRKNIRRIRQATISVKVVRTNGKSKSKKIPLLVNRRDKRVDVSLDTNDDELVHGGHDDVQSGPNVVYYDDL